VVAGPESTDPRSQSAPRPDPEGVPWTPLTPDPRSPRSHRPSSCVERLGAHRPGSAVCPLRHSSPCPLCAARWSSHHHHPQESQEPPLCSIQVQCGPAQRRAPELTSLSEMAAGCSGCRPTDDRHHNPTGARTPNTVHHPCTTCRLWPTNSGGARAPCESCLYPCPPRQASQSVARQGARTGAQLPAAAPRPV